MSAREWWSLVRWEAAHRVWQRRNRRRLARLVAAHAEHGSALLEVWRGLDRATRGEVVDLLDGVDLTGYAGSEVERQARVLEDVVRRGR